MTEVEQRHGESGVGPVARDSLTSLVYNNLRQALMEGRFRPGHRFKIRDLAATMNVSETPIREALMQLVRARALKMQSGRSIIVNHITAKQYIELRTVRLFLEGLAAEHATTRISEVEIDRMEAIHRELIRAEKERRWSDAVRANWQFHRGLYDASGLAEVLAILDDIWMRNGPLLNFHYPDAPPTYPNEHQHLSVLKYLRQRRPDMVREAIQADMMEGGQNLVRLLEEHGGTGNITPGED
ncbi:DNA-binding transcriptional regulator, GntR family [Enhydrobacter aerosaccus]|uniref:DNA-binding transcriptional regulator, GntR family n=1 Tax=Enhydrobacter aerosaccus TaxID=225324 RepID=A0A1T4T771_9HYPH|nr:GntR family transcriptional regulator [Enhydrobacter aerosaccus]SKA36008.1 DNA-binding transcriptional regulator, GntR family [Enhydrobacter aerosaccus]